MKEQWKAGASFGLTSGPITTMGLMVGLHSGTHAKLAVIGGVVAEHVFIALLVVVLTHFIGDWINGIFVK